MKNKATSSFTLSCIAPRLLVACLAAIAVAVASAQKGQQEAAMEELAPDQTIIVNVEDLVGLANIETDFIRENLLETAFYNAAAEHDWLGDFEFRYNYSVPSDRGGYLEFTVLEWERSVTNFYEFRASARYRTVGGETINLGVFDGIRSGIAVVTGWEAGDAFVDAAESAFNEALDELKAATGA